MGTRYQELKLSGSTEPHGTSSRRIENGGFLILDESSFPTLPKGACVRLQCVSYCQLQAGDYVLIWEEGKIAVHRFVKVSTADGVTCLLLVDGHGHEQALAFTRLVGLVVGVKLEGSAFNPNPQSFFQRAAFKLRYSLGITPAA